MKRRIAVLSMLTLLYGTALSAQKLVPHPFVYAGGELMGGGGYAPLAAIGGTGLRIDSKHFLLNTEAWYDNGHKTNDNTGLNPKGHDRGLDGTAYFRTSSGWFFGAGTRWSQLSTTNYRKSSLHPTFGGGKDYFRQPCALENCVGGFSMRIGVDYLLRGTDHLNGTQGPLLTLFIPSPSARGHIFYRETIGAYVFHDTVTDPNNTELTRQQIANRSKDSFVEFTLMYRF
jgi:hypothetical protein